MEKSGWQLVKRNWRGVKSSFFPVIFSRTKDNAVEDIWEKQVNNLLFTYEIPFQICSIFEDFPTTSHFWFIFYGGSVQISIAEMSWGHLIFLNHSIPCYSIFFDQRPTENVRVVNHFFSHFYLGKNNQQIWCWKGKKIFMYVCNL